MAERIKLSTKQILNLCKIAWIEVDADASVFSEETEDLETEYVIIQDECYTVAYLDEYPEEYYSLSD